MSIRLRMNGRAVTAVAAPVLYSVLRNDLHLNGAK